MNKTKGVALFIAGAGLGAGLGLLFAPRSGKHTRARIANTANRTKHRLEDVRDDLRTHLSEWVEDASEAIASNVAAGKATVAQGGERVREVLDYARERMDEGKERVEHYLRSVAG